MPFLDLEESGIGPLKGAVSFCSLNLKSVRMQNLPSPSPRPCFGPFSSSSLPAPVLSRPCARPPASSKGSQVSFEDIFVLTFFLCCFRCVHEKHQTQAGIFRADDEFLYMSKATFYRNNATMLCISEERTKGKDNKSSFKDSR